MKKQIVEEQGFEAAQTFPVFEDRMPTQMLTFLRLSRVQEPGQLALISFKDDRIVSQLNEYEILQLLMGDCRERLAAYRSNTEDDLKMLQDPGLTGKERVACEMRLVEKRIINGFMDGVRRKLAPIRGIPTKGGGMQDPNADLVEIFDTIEVSRGVRDDGDYPLPHSRSPRNLAAPSDINARFPCLAVDSQGTDEAVRRA